jgi:tetratricopeptide (TPR) repeat protein
VAVVAICVFAYAVLTENRPVPVPAAQANVQVAPLDQTAPAPTMNAMAEIRALDERVNANPNDLGARLQYANILHDNAFFDKAIAAYRVYLAKRPSDANARVDLGVCLQATNANDEALAEMKRALKDDPKHVQAHFNIGIVLLKQQKLSEATEWFKKTVALAPNSEVGQRAQQLLSQHNPQQFNQTP